MLHDDDVSDLSKEDLVCLLMKKINEVNSKLAKDKKDIKYEIQQILNLIEKSIKLDLVNLECDNPELNMIKDNLVVSLFKLLELLKETYE